MRVKRLKHCKKHISFYKTTFGFREPYQILVDLTFCQFALTNKINIKEQVGNYIDGDSQLFTTKCILDEGKLLGPKLHGAVFIAKQFKLRKCNHIDRVPAQECILSMIGDSNSHHLFVASQDRELEESLRKIPGVPILRIHYNALVLEKPSYHTKKEACMIDKSKCEMNEDEMRKIKELKAIHSIGTKKEKKEIEKRAKGANPLSMKKKKNIQPVFKNKQDSSKRRRRKKKKISSHVIAGLKEKQPEM